METLTIPDFLRNQQNLADERRLNEQRFDNCMKDRISEGDTVRVDFHGSQFTLSSNAIVVRVPAGANDSWILKDCDTSTIHYVSEGCTITKRRETG